MSKRKFVVEALVDYIYRYFEKGQREHLAGNLKINGMQVPIEVDVKSNQNAGGEAWDWAQSHWDEFLDKNGPEITVTLSDGSTVVVPTTLRWACVTGVYGPKGGDVPIESVSYNTGKNRGYAAGAKKERGETIQKAAIRELKNHEPRSRSRKTEVLRSTNPVGRPQAIPEDNPNKTSQGAEVLSFEDMKAQKIQEAMEADE
jgi:hypothetical protein